MANGSGRTVEEIRRESEANRARLTGTVEELRSTLTETVADLKQQLNPSVVKDEVIKYARTRGETLMRDAKEAARRNPIQAVAIGAGLALPAIRMARAIPLPLVLMGAGYFLAGTKRGQEIAADASENISHAASQVGDAVDGIRNQAKDSIAEVGGAASETMRSIKEAMSGGPSSKDSSPLADTLHVASDAIDRTRDAAGVASIQAQAMSRQTADAIGQYPLVVAGVGILLGALIAGAIPKTRAEEDMLGEASARLRTRARVAAEDGLDRVKDIAGDISSVVSDQAIGQGLDADGLSAQMRDVGERVRSVAERAIETAMAQPDDVNGPKGNTPATTEGNHHG